MALPVSLARLGEVLRPGLLKPSTRLRLTAHALRSLLGARRHDIDRRVAGLPANRQFMTARQAVALVPDGATVISTGMSGNMRCAILYWAVRERFEKTGHPRGLTWLAAGGIGGRGRWPGTVEEVARDGLVDRHISGHLETANAILGLAARGCCELHTLPLGVLALLVEGQSRGEDSLLSSTGTGTFLDPRVGRGSAVVAGMGRSLVSLEGDRLRYRLPPIHVALFAAAAADAEGNLYMTHASLLGESREAARAARRNGGKVIATVAQIVPRRPTQIFLAADEVDAIVVEPRNEQVGSVPQIRYWPMFVPGRATNLREDQQAIGLLNALAGMTPRRGPLDAALARRAAALLVGRLSPGAKINIGTGLPEEVSRLIFEAGLLDQVTFLVESGAYGGLPAPGIFFGAALQPQKLISSAAMFRLMERDLDATVLGFLQIDSSGNVNVSRRGPGPLGYVGPGGFIEVSSAAKTVVFLGAWTANARASLVGGRLRIRRPGRPKLVAHVDEITFSGAEALRRGQDVWYVTTVGTFHLTALGMELVETVPGVVVQRDIVQQSSMRIVLPPSGQVPVADPALVTGRGFRLAFRRSS